MAKSKFDPAHIARFKESGKTIAEYCRAEGISIATLQYHLAKSRQREIDQAVKFISVPALRADWFTLQIGAGGVRVKLNLDFRI